MRIQIIVGSIREGRRSRPVADWAYQLASARADITVELVDLRDWDLPLFDLKKPPIMGNYENALQQRWADVIGQADGYLFVTPEYNHGYTSVLKNALDYIYGEWSHKPASFISYGNVSGARGVEQLRLVLIELRVVPLRDAIHIRNVNEKSKDGQFIGDTTDTKQFEVMFNELLWWANALSAARSNSEKG